MLPLVACATVQQFEFLQITDLHIDPYYRSDSPSSELCREDDVKSVDRAYFGRPECDSPLMLMQLMVD